jgi:hypothetical protein
VRAVCCAVRWRITSVRGTGLSDVEWEASLLHGPGGLGFKFRLVDGLCRDFAWFICYSARANSGIVLLNRSRPL